MYIDHFGGKSLSRQTRDWLAAAADDAGAKLDDCQRGNASDGRYYSSDSRSV